MCMQESVYLDWDVWAYCVYKRVYIQIIVDGHNMHARECILRSERTSILCIQESVCSDCCQWA